MSYTKTNWQDLPSENTPINATRLNNIENGIANSDGAIDVDEYSNSSTYAIGDYCIYNNKLYRCIVAITTSEAFNSSKWEQTRILDEVGTIDEDLENATKGYQETEFIKDLEITDSAGVNGKIKLVGGNTQQDSYEGKNLFNLYDSNVTTKSVTISIDNNILTQTNTGSYCRSMWQISNLKTDGTEYIIKAKYNNPNNCSIRIAIYDETNSTEKKTTNTVTDTSGELSLTIAPSNSVRYIRLYSNALSTTNSNAVTFYEIQFEEGSTATSYEPYVGGTPSPNPDYPQDIINVGSNVNLFDKDNVNKLNYYFERNGDTLKYNVLNTIVYIPCKGNTTYSITRKEVLNNMFQVGTTEEIPAGGVVVSDFASETTAKTITLTTSSNAKYLLYRCSNKSTDNLSQIYANTKIEEGLPTGYTPYNRGGIDVKVENKNLFDIEATPLINSSTTRVRPNLKTFLKAGTYTISYLGADQVILNFYKNINDDTQSSSSGWQTGNYTFTLNNDIYIIPIFRKNNDATINASDVKNVQIEQGSSATSYILHQEQNIQVILPQGMELCKIGNYSDKIFHNIPSNPMYNASLVEGGWYEYAGIDKYRVTSSNNLSLGGLSNPRGFIKCADFPSNKKNANSASSIELNYMYCNYLSLVALGASSDNSNIIGFSNTGTSSEIRFRLNTGELNLQDTKDWLDAHELWFYYVTTTPTYTQITDTDTDTLEALYQIEHLLMYEEYTHIYIDDEVQAYLQLDYLYNNEINNTFGSIIDALEERIHVLEINS